MKVAFWVRTSAPLLPPLHSHHHTHRDLKMENILLDKKKKSIKLVGESHPILFSLHSFSLSSLPTIVSKQTHQHSFLFSLSPPIPQPSIPFPLSLLTLLPSLLPFLLLFLPPPPSLLLSLPPYSPSFPLSLPPPLPSLLKTLVWATRKDQVVSYRPTVAVQSMQHPNSSFLGRSMVQKWMSGACEHAHTLTRTCTSSHSPHSHIPHLHSHICLPTSSPYTHPYTGVSICMPCYWVSFPSAPHVMAQNDDSDC